MGVVEDVPGVEGGRCRLLDHRRHPEVTFLAGGVIDVQARRGVPEFVRLRDLPQSHDPAADLGEVIVTDVRQPHRGVHMPSSWGPWRPQGGSRTSKASEAEGLKTFEPASAAVTRGSLYVHACMNTLLDKTLLA